MTTVFARETRVLRRRNHVSLKMDKLITVLNQNNEKLQEVLKSLQKRAIEPNKPTVEDSVTMEKFDDTAKEPFDNYLDRLEAYFDVREIKDSKKKLSMLVCMIGPKLFAALKTLLHPQTYQQKSYEEVKQLLQDHVNAKFPLILNRYSFMNRKQHEFESVIEYAFSLRVLVSICEYPKTFEKMVLRDVFVSGLRSEIALARLFQKGGDVSFEEAVDVALEVEAATDGFAARNFFDKVCL